MIKKEDNGSIYDFVNKDYSAPVQDVPVKNTETPHQNRENLSKPYSGQFQQNVEKGKSAVAESKSNASSEWMKFVLNRDTACEIAKKVNLSFTRDEEFGVNFNKEKVKYFRLYNDLTGHQ